MTPQVQPPAPVPIARPAWSLRRFGSVLLAVVLIATPAALSWPRWRSALTLATTRQTEPFTELYFDNVQALPGSYLPDRPEVVTFTIRNRQGVRVRYDYAVLVDGVVATTATTPEVSDSGSFQVEQTFVIRGARPRVRIEVRLPATGQSIHLWLTRAGKGGGTAPQTHPTRSFGSTRSTH